MDKIRINPGNFHPDYQRARELFGEFLDLCKEHGKAIRIGLNHGSLGKYIIEKYGNTPEAMALAAMEWVKMCMDKEFYNAVVSLKASNTVVMVEAYRTLARMMQDEGVSEHLTDHIQEVFDSRIEHEITRILNGW